MFIISLLIGFMFGCILVIVLKRENKARRSGVLSQQEMIMSQKSGELEDKMWYEEQLTFLLRFNEKLISAVGLQDVVRCIAEAAHNFLPVDRAVFLVWDKNLETFSLASTIGWERGSGYLLVGKDSIAGFVVHNREVLLVPDLDKDNYLKKLNKEPYLQKNFISAPLLHQDDVLGVLHVCNKRTGPFTQRDVSIVSNIVRLGAISMQNARLYEQAVKRAAELKTAYDELRDMHDKLVQSEKLKAIGQLASGVAHEMRNPLGTIIQGATYLEQITPPDKKDERETLSVIKDSAMRADGIVISLLDFSRVAKLDLHPESVVSVLDSSLNLVKTELRNIKVSKEIQGDLPRVLADKNKLMQVFINLFMNAIHAMSDGGQLIIRVFSKNTSEVTIEIEDTGSGISEENLKKLFEPFFTTRGPGSGTGLGLAICRNIIARHNGSINIKSHEKKGTRVVVTLRAFKEGETNG